jgi:hypothetical protein
VIIAVAIYQQLKWFEPMLMNIRDIAEYAINTLRVSDSLQTQILAA